MESTERKVLNMYKRDVYRLWDDDEDKIIAFAFSEPQLKRDMDRLNLSGRMEHKIMPMYLVDMMAKEIYKKNRR